MADPAGTLTVRVPGYPTPIQFADWTHDRLYHTVQYGMNQGNEVQAFVGAQGAPIPNGTRVLTEVDTNIPRSGDNGLSEGWEGLIYVCALQVVREIATVGQQPALADSSTAGAEQRSRPAHVGGADPSYLAGGVLFDFLRKTYIRLTVNQKIQSEGPAEKYPQASGISVFGTTTDLEVANNGVPSPRDARVFVLPIWLRANIGYVLKLRPQATYAAITGTGDGMLDDWASSGGVTYKQFFFDVRVELNGLIKRPVT